MTRAFCFRSVVNSFTKGLSTCDHGRKLLVMPGGVRCLSLTARDNRRKRACRSWHGLGIFFFFSAVIGPLLDEGLCMTFPLCPVLCFPDPVRSGHLSDVVHPPCLLSSFSFFFFFFFFLFFRVLKTANRKKFDVVVVSPRNHVLFTPLLNSTSGNPVVSSKYHRASSEHPFRRRQSFSAGKGKTAQHSHSNVSTTLRLSASHSKKQTSNRHCTI